MSETPTIMALAETLQNLLFDNPNAGVAQLEACLESADALRGASARDFTEAALGFCRRLYEADRSREALPLAELCAKLAARLRNKPLQIRAATAWGNLLGDCGAQAEAMQQHVQVLQWAEAAGDARNMAASLVNIGTLFQLAGLPRQAIETYRKIVFSPFLTIEPCLVSGAPTNLAQCHLELGETNLGLAVIGPVFERKIEVSPHDTILAYRTYTRLLALAGQVDQAGQVLAEMETLAAQHPSPRITFTLLLAQGSYALASGQREAGERQLRAALDLAQDTQHGVADVLLALAQGLQQAGCATEAEAYLYQLAEWLRQMHGVAPPPARKKPSRHDLAMMQMLDCSGTYKQIARDKRMNHEYLRHKSSKLFKRLGVKNRVEAVDWLRTLPMANFAHIAVADGLATALGERLAYLSDIARALLCAKQPGSVYPLQAAGSLTEQIIVGFNTCQRRGDRRGALQLAEALNQRVSLAQAVMQAGAAATTLACLP